MPTNRARIAGSTLIALALCAASQAQPNIEVRIDNVVQSLGQEFEFDPTDVGNSRPLIVVVRNIGSADLQFPSGTPIFFAGGFADQFSVIQPPLEGGNKLSPNGSTAFRVDFRPTIPKANMATVVNIPTNDPDSPVFSLDLLGVVPVPEFVLLTDGQVVAPQSQVNVTATPIGQSTSLTLRIENRGDRELTLTDPIDVSGGFGSAAFSIVQPAGETIAPDQAVEFAVVFAPTQTGAATAQIGVSTNDIGNYPAGRLLFTVRGVGQAAADDESDEQGDEDAEEQENSDTDNDEPTGGADEQAGNQADENAAGDTEDESASEIESADDVSFVSQSPGLCGFGAPVGLALGLASLTGWRGRRKSTASLR